MTREGMERRAKGGHDERKGTKREGKGTTREGRARRAKEGHEAGGQGRKRSTVQGPFNRLVQQRVLNASSTECVHESGFQGRVLEGSGFQGSVLNECVQDSVLNGCVHESVQESEVEGIVLEGSELACASRRPCSKSTSKRACSTSASKRAFRMRAFKRASKRERFQESVLGLSVLKGAGSKGAGLKGRMRGRAYLLLRLELLPEYALQHRTHPKPTPP